MNATLNPTRSKKNSKSKSKTRHGNVLVKGFHCKPEVLQALKGIGVDFLVLPVDHLPDHLISITNGTLPFATRNNQREIVVYAPPDSKTYWISEDTVSKIYVAPEATAKEVLDAAYEMLGILDSLRASASPKSVRDYLRTYGFSIYEETEENGTVTLRFEFGDAPKGIVDFGETVSAHSLFILLLKRYGFRWLAQYAEPKLKPILQACDKESINAAVELIVSEYDVVLPWRNESLGMLVLSEKDVPEITVKVSLHTEGVDLEGDDVIPTVIRMLFKRHGSALYRSLERNAEKLWLFTKKPAIQLPSTGTLVPFSQGDIDKVSLLSDICSSNGGDIIATQPEVRLLTSVELETSSTDSEVNIAPLAGHLLVTEMPPEGGRADFLATVQFKGDTYETKTGKAIVALRVGVKKGQVQLEERSTESLEKLDLYKWQPLVQEFSQNLKKLSVLNPAGSAVKY